MAPVPCVPPCHQIREICDVSLERYMTSESHGYIGDGDTSDTAVYTGTGWVPWAGVETHNVLV